MYNMHSHSLNRSPLHDGDIRFMKFTEPGLGIDHAFPTRKVGYIEVLLDAVQMFSACPRIEASTNYFIGYN